MINPALLYEFAETSGGGTLPGNPHAPSFCAGMMFGLVLAVDHPDYAARLFHLIEDEVIARSGPQKHPDEAIRELMRRISA